MEVTLGSIWSAASVYGQIIVHGFQGNKSSTLFLVGQIIFRVLGISVNGGAF